MTDPVPPINVALVYQDGRRVPVDCTYDGFKDGIHRWLILTPLVGLGGLKEITADTLPAETSIALEVEP